ncbi:MAG: DUF6794 domain-containing protein [Bacteroidota bacterium]
MAVVLFSISRLSGQLLFKSPRNISHALKILDKKLSVEVKSEIINSDPDSLMLLTDDFNDEFDVMNEWFWRWTRKSTTKSTRLGKYYNKRGLKIPNDMTNVVLRCFQLNLKKLPIVHRRILEPFVLRQQKHDKEDRVRFTTDSLRGIYIPQNLEDCFRTLDKIYPDSTKLEIAKLTEKEYSINNHLFGVGIWMRNNWQLWGGSRLSKYFNDLEIYHPDDMSGIIMDSYHRYLTDKDIRLDEQIKAYKDFWKAAKQNGGG